MPPVPAFTELYIPLCLYFNPKKRIFVPIAHSFTFHYVSILICPCFTNAIVCSSFTFHYVSILINGNILCCCGSSVLYIPLCLYFNSIAECFRSRRNYFTFHYVSILIITEVLSKMKASLFTFHYVSILMETATFVIFFLYPLHSIMSLF